MMRAETNDTIVVDLGDVDEACDGPGTCHGCMCWCDRCGDVSQSCDAPRCDVHRCQSCNEVRLDRDQERDLCYVCYVCDPLSYPTRWPAVAVFMYAWNALTDQGRLSRALPVITAGASAIVRNPWADRLLEDLDAGIERIALGDDREWDHHPRVRARSLRLHAW